ERAPLPRARPALPPPARSQRTRQTRRGLRHTPRVPAPSDESGLRRFLGVFRYGRRAVELVWSTSKALTLALAALTLVVGLLPAGAAYVGQLIVDAVVHAAQV